MALCSNDYVIQQATDHLVSNLNSTLKAFDLLFSVSNQSSSLDVLALEKLKAYPGFNELIPKLIALGDKLIALGEKSPSKASCRS